MRYATRLEFCNENAKCTNNIVEYEAVLQGLRKIRALRVQSCEVKTDSKLVANKVDKEYVALVLVTLVFQDINTALQVMRGILVTLVF